jgi:hypothetical protein
MWRVTRGTITIELSAPGIRGREPLACRVTIRIDGSEFIGGAGARAQQTQPIVLTAIVGRRARRAPRFRSRVERGAAPLNYHQDSSCTPNAHFS